MLFGVGYAKFIAYSFGLAKEWAPIGLFFRTYCLPVPRQFGLQIAAVY
jgi:hypothetical protein